ncbi:hypothetical protein [Haloferula sargassicola]|uniref:Uncharacterized protein n=1 Tax=Haloferula sargassicola TaxID=490096 RepID=A0ABP9UJ80_9BACT
MADRKSNRNVELKVVGDDRESTEEVVRLEGESAVTVDRLKVEKPEEITARLVAKEEAAKREKQPELDALLEENRIDLDPESDWKEQEGSKPVPHGWFVIIFTLIAAAILTSVFYLTRPEDQQEAEISRAAAIESIQESKADEKEAEALVDNIRSTVEHFTEGRTVEDMLPWVRDPERVAPLMRDWEKRHPIAPPRLTFFGGVAPVLKTQDREMWRAEYIGPDESRLSLLVQVMENRKPKVDWETFVCYQPMDWDEYVAERPSKPMDFRIYLEPDAGHLYAFEFRDDSQWRGYQLTTRNSTDFLIGYVPRDGELDQLFERMLVANRGKAALILTLRVPEEAKTLRGVYIDQLVSDNWVILGHP